MRSIGINNIDPSRLQRPSRCKADVEATLRQSYKDALPRAQDNPKFFLKILYDEIGQLPTPMKVNTLAEIIIGLCKELDILGAPSSKILRDICKDDH